MRIAFLNTLQQLVEKNKDIVLVSGDLGFSVFDDFVKKYPRQYINTGIAEQNMTGVAAGMAIEGKIPVIYSIVPFATMRNFEQIKNDVCYQNLNVKIVGVGAGFSYGPYGHTHYGLEDVGILRTLANITILTPGDPVETRLAVEEALRLIGPVYIRLGKSGEPIIHNNKPKFAYGKGILLQDGSDITILGSGILLKRAFEVTKKLEENGFCVRLISMPFIKPIDIKIILESIEKTEAIFTLEEHSVIGGLGSAVAEVIAENGQAVIFKRFGAQDRFSKVTGSQEFMRTEFGLSVEQVVSKIKKIFKKIK